MSININKNLFIFLYLAQEKLQKSSHNTEQIKEYINYTMLNQNSNPDCLNEL